MQGCPRGTKAILIGTVGRARSNATLKTRLKFVRTSGQSCRRLNFAAGFQLTTRDAGKVVHVMASLLVDASKNFYFEGVFYSLKFRNFDLIK